jgi:ribosomal-protein-alanine N-acetyltransferase
MPALGWPATLFYGPVGLRPLRMRDAGAWSELRLRNEQWLKPWDGRPPNAPESTWAERNSPGAYGVTLRSYRRDAKLGRCLPFAITLDNDLVGQLTVGNIQRGAFHSGYVGYWVAEEAAGQGVMPTALALAVDHCFTEAGLHRIEANIRPENGPSRRVVEKLGFREEGLHPRFLFIDGAWRDHLCFALTAEDVPDGLMARWKS